MNRIVIAPDQCAAFTVVLNVTIHHGDDLWRLREQAIEDIKSQLDPVLLDVMYLPETGATAVVVVPSDCPDDMMQRPSVQEWFDSLPDGTINGKDGEQRGE